MERNFGMLMTPLRGSPGGDMPDTTLLVFFLLPIPAIEAFSGDREATRRLWKRLLWGPSENIRRVSM